MGGQRAGATVGDRGSVAQPFIGGEANCVDAAGCNGRWAVNYVSFSDVQSFYGRQQTTALFRTLPILSCERSFPCCLRLSTCSICDVIASDSFRLLQPAASIAFMSCIAEDFRVFSFRTSLLLRSAINECSNVNLINAYEIMSVLLEPVKDL